eukprot:FR739496.1.p1 GENE.FR739496.1~~FR739496.1.p1  ORF type:complete len:122 (-),score=39.14 FR739496.1:57-422(-)
MLGKKRGPPPFSRRKGRKEGGPCVFPVKGCEGFGKTGERSPQRGFFKGGKPHGLSFFSSLLGFCPPFVWEAVDFFVNLFPGGGGPYGKTPYQPALFLGFLAFWWPFSSQFLFWGYPLYSGG